MQRRTFIFAGAASCIAPPVCAQALNMAAAAAYSAERQGVSLLVMGGGRVLYEDYPNRGAPDRGWELASGTKSFTGIMAAAGVKDGLLELNEPAAESLSEWRNDERRLITISHLLSLTSGIEGGPLARPPTYADAVAQRPVAPPGERFSYGPTPFQIFGEIMRRKTNGDPLAYLSRRILDPLRIRPTQWRRGRDGYPHMPSGAALTARDWARFGVCVHEGGQGLVDRAALAQCFAPSEANPGYGLSWWLLRQGLVPPGPRAGLDVSAPLADRFGPIAMAAGAGGQRLYIVSGVDLIIVRQASGVLRALRRGDDWSDATFLRTLLR